MSTYWDRYLAKNGTVLLYKSLAEILEDFYHFVEDDKAEEFIEELHK